MARVEQFEVSRTVGAVFLAQLKAESRQHPQEGAVHQVAFRQVEHEEGLASLPKAVDHALEIHAAMKAGPSCNPDADHAISHPHRQVGRSITHTTSLTSPTLPCSSSALGPDAPVTCTLASRPAFAHSPASQRPGERFRRGPAHVECRVQRALTMSLPVKIVRI